MTRQQHIAIWALIISGFLLVLMALSSVLLPFVAAMAVAYLLDPVADRLETKGISRTVATALITAVFFLVLLIVVLALVPVLLSQLNGFLSRLPGYVESFRDNLLPNLMELAQQYGIPLKLDVKTAIGQHAGEAASVLGKLVAGVLGGGQAVLSMLSLLVVTPVVSFYLLRDWDTMMALIDEHLPRRQAEVIRAQARAIDGVLAGFARGQMMVCLALGSFYGIGLSLVGLDFGLVIGLGAGAVSFIPYVGTILGFVVSMGVALVQFWPDWTMIAIVAAVFGAGQFIEGNFLTPKLVGDRVGLHPVWIMFGLFAGGALFGFVGMLIAVPVCAVIGVLTRFTLERYRGSALYHGGPAKIEPPAEPPATP
ncbi:MAG: AI-2E family transporter [Ferrovibrio sp.]|jgi:predicted PurR-regulated permease PerM|nr:AI-2E family transporter [Ferrovibrio sp.]